MKWKSQRVVLNAMSGMTHIYQQKDSATNMKFNFTNFHGSKYKSMLNTLKMFISVYVENVKMKIWYKQNVTTFKLAA